VLLLSLFLVGFISSLPNLLRTKDQVVVVVIVVVGDLLIKGVGACDWHLEESYS
jgi:hypothetical protein